MAVLNKEQKEERAIIINSFLDITETANILILNAMEQKILKNEELINDDVLFNVMLNRILNLKEQRKVYNSGR
jgi:hypothetical protein